MTDRTADRLEIAELMNRYSFAILDRDWKAWLDTFADDAHVDYSTAGGVVGAPGEMAAWLDNTMSMFDVTISQSSNTLSLYKMVMRIPGDQPTYMEACGWYQDTVTRTASGWRLSNRFEHLLYVK
jgi:SnoaL-like domain